MDRRMLRNLIDRLTRLEQRSARYRLGVITDDSPLSVELGGSGVSYTDVMCLASYSTPTVGDTVAVLVFGNDLLILGAL